MGFPPIWEREVAITSNFLALFTGEHVRMEGYLISFIFLYDGGHIWSGTIVARFLTNNNNEDHHFLNVYLFAYRCEVDRKSFSKLILNLLLEKHLLRGLKKIRHGVRIIMMLASLMYKLVLRILVAADKGMNSSQF
jgi:hypothetical protein